jgi:DNA-binding response OmpR family regulator
MNTKAKISKPETVLVVEDETLINWDVSDTLREEGFDVLQAFSGEEAVAQLERRRDIRLVFTDVNLPGEIDGIALADEIRRRWPATELLMTSAHRGADVQKLDFIAALGRFVPKPYPPRAVARRIHDIVQRAA